MNRTTIREPFCAIIFLFLAGCTGGAEDRTSETELEAPARERSAASRQTRSAASPTGTAPKKAAPAPPPAKDGAAAAGKGSKGGKTSSQSASAREVAALIGELKTLEPRKAQGIFWKLTDVKMELIPDLIAQVENPDTSNVESLKVLVVAKDFIPKSSMAPFLATRLHGMGRMEIVQEVVKDDLRVVQKEYTKMSYGIAKNRKYYVVLEKYGGFPVGIVVRAALMNRFRSAKHPDWSDDDPSPGKLIAWWRAFHDKVKGEL